MSGVIEDLTEEEVALWEILSDESGIDAAEFLWYDASMKETDFCWRAWDFQWSWFRRSGSHVLDHSSRAIGKSFSILLRAFIFIFNYPNNEMLIAAPTLNHLEFITEKIERRIKETRLSQEMMSTKLGSVTHRPFLMKFLNGAKIMGRIPGADGSNFKGAHPIWLELDEAQNLPDAAWNELVETLKRGEAGSAWRAHGVTTGPGGKFHEYAYNPNSEWIVNRYVAMHRPNWTDQERQEKVQLYGSPDSPDYRRNLLGLPGDTMNPLFVTSMLMKGVEDDLEAEYNTDEYSFIRINREMIEDVDGVVEAILPLRTSHLANYKTFWIGCDVGFTNDPTEILVFAEYTPKKDEINYLKRRKKAIPADGTTKFKLVTRVKLMQVSAPNQRRIVQLVFDHYKPQAFAMDATGNGLPLLQEIQENIPEYVKYIKGYKANEKILVDWAHGKSEDEAEIYREVKEYSLDVMRELVDHQRLWLPWDKELLQEFQGQEYSIKKSSGLDRYAKRRFSRGSFHTLDAAALGMLGWKQSPVEEITKKKPQTSVIDRPIF